MINKSSGFTFSTTGAKDSCKVDVQHPVTRIGVPCVDR